MNWSLLLIGFALAVIMGAGVAALLFQLRPQWSARRRLLLAASALPGVTVLASLAGVGFIASSEHGQGERMEDLAIAAVTMIGGTFALLAFIGGAIGASLVQRRRGR